MAFWAGVLGWRFMVARNVRYYAFFGYSVWAKRDACRCTSRRTTCVIRGRRVLLRLSEKMKAINPYAIHTACASQVEC